MAYQNLLEVKPHKVKGGLEGKIITIHGEKKSGKTWEASKSEKPILFAFEAGFNLIDGINAVIMSEGQKGWLEMKNYIKQLSSDDMKKAYKTVIIDTASLMWSSCVDFIKTQKGIEDLGDLGFGKGHRAAEAEFRTLVNELGKLGYTVLFLNHSVKKDYVDPLGALHKQTINIALDKQPKEILTALSDLTIFIRNELDPQTNKNRPVAYLRAGQYGDDFIDDAGGRYPSIPSKIEWSFANLTKAIEEADEFMKSMGVKLSSKNKTVLEESATINVSLERSWAEVTKDVNETLQIIADKINQGDNHLNKKVKDIVAAYLGTGNKISEATPVQQELVEAALSELKALLKAE